MLICPLFLCYTQKKGAIFMKHPETNRIVPGARFAVLFIHGILGTPNQFRKVIDLEGLVPEDWSVRNLVLPGHCMGVREFGASSGSQWRGYARDAFLELAETHEAVLLVGHSMGTLFSLQLEREFPEKVGGLFLMNVPLRPWIRPWGAVNCLRLALGCVRLDRPREASILTAGGVETTPYLWRYLCWIPRFLDLLNEIIRTERDLSPPSVPYQVIQSRKDELVSNQTVRVLNRKGLMRLRELPASSHFYYPAQEQEDIFSNFREILYALSTKQ